MKANIFSSIGKYALFLRQAFKKPESRKMLRKQFIVEIDRLIMSSIVIVGVISLFMGGVLVIQTASNMENPFLDRMLIGYMVRESMILEFSSTMVALILAGKMGSSIASEIGSMRITQQLDAMEMMGINSASFVARPKILAATIVSPILTLLSFVLGLVGGGLIVYFTDIIPTVKHCHTIFHGPEILFQRLLYGLQLLQDDGVLFPDIVSGIISRFQCQRRLARRRPFKHEGHRVCKYPDTYVGPHNNPVAALLI